MDAHLVNFLKNKYISDFNKFTNVVSKGYKPDYSILLLELIVIENSDYFDNNIYEYLMGL